ncbi:flavodoxin family protein [Thermodesulforhabdus norvegica]|uniref:Multimeric flavodoxin WrbA n=1 Tax=Thermodesulforhabdus norvegica TaxID=39841 RepID=A0A1I4W2S3_9BACT|nr:flavodoxin family protein [Thermodesulforhabdus norvegica]SFN07755.1 Multimeric flavodoxin WrbA [Thermodesulforhabdus norvegica]
MKVTAIYGSPRKDGNTDRLLKRFVEGVRDEGVEVVEFFLRDMNIAPCREIYGCKRNGRCVIDDDFHVIADEMSKSDAIVVATPVFFYAVSAHTKAFIDRCQSLWVKKYWINKVPFGKGETGKPGVLISVGATRGKKLFDGILLTMRYFFDCLDAKLWAALLYRGLDGKDDILNHPEYLDEAYAKGRELARVVREGKGAA